MADKEQKGKIIIKKVKKGGHGGAHGGSWKVAYADFVTAMMAFFLVMWLVNSLPQEKRKEISKYFQSFSLFDTGGKPGLVPAQDLSVMRDENPPPVVEPLSQGPEAPAKQATEAEKLAEGLKKEIETKAPDLKGQVIVKVEGNQTIFELVDDAKGKALFALGKADLTPDAKRVLDAIAPKIAEEGRQGGKVTIEGHTDAYTYAGENFTNWELSTDRASNARREMERAGLGPDMIAQVSGYAATKPYVPDNPYDARNRRIRLVVQTPAKPGENPPAQEAAPQEAAKAKAQAQPEPQPQAPADQRELLDQHMDKLYDQQTKGKF